MRTSYWTLGAIALLILFAAWVAWPGNPGVDLQIGGLKIEREIKVYRGLDLQGGMQVTLEADVPPGTSVDRDSMEAVRTIIENRINALGVSEPVIQLQPESNRVLVELPGIRNPEQAVETLKGTGLLEFVDTGDTWLPPGAEITTSLGGPQGAQPAPGQTPADPASPTPAATPAPEATPTPGPTATPETPPAAGQTPAPGATPAPEATPPPATEPTEPVVYPTIMTGRDLARAEVGFDEFGRPMIRFSLTSEGAKKFAEHTSANVGKYLTITMDKRVISSPVIRGPITEGDGVIEGGFALDEAQGIVMQLKYGALPVSLKVVENRTVGPTLGEESIQKSLIAGVVGLLIVAGFMLAYYRFPGLVAVFALLVYATIVFAAFKLIPVVLTLAGIAGFILSIGMAVDANILIFERTKEELRSGKTVGAAIEAGFRRAWSSIFDSNVATLITCAILFWFGLSFGASIIRGFALTLGIGVLVSMFTAITVTRTVLRVLHYWASLRTDTARRWSELWSW